MCCWVRDMKDNGIRADSGAQNAVGPALRVENVSKAYPARKSLFRRSRNEAPAHLVLRDVSFSIERGETLGLLGPNGAGKTTLLKIITTLLFPTSGSVYLSGENVFQNSRKHRSRMGLVTCDERSFYWRLTGWQNLRFFAALYGLSKKDSDRRIAELLETLGLSQAANRPYQEYSTGMRQKMAIARGLLGQPQLVLYDEPTRSLDPLSAFNIRSYIRDHRKQTPWQTHLIATNQLNEAEFLCDRVIIIGKGRLLAFGTIEEVKQMWRDGDYEAHVITWRGPRQISIAPDPAAGLLAAEVRADTNDGASSIKVQVRKDSEGLSLVLRTLLGHGAEIVRCELQEANFDEIFCSLVQGEAPPVREAAVAGEPKV